MVERRSSGAGLRVYASLVALVDVPVIDDADDASLWRREKSRRQAYMRLSDTTPSRHAAPNRNREGNSQLWLL
jgi:hypothetical protein